VVYRLYKYENVQPKLPFPLKLNFLHISPTEIGPAVQLVGRCGECVNTESVLNARNTPQHHNGGERGGEMSFSAHAYIYSSNAERTSNGTIIIKQQ
jgi:hypothetical protein